MSPSGYLTYGDAPDTGGIDPAGTLAYLEGLGFGDGYLRRARRAVAEYQEKAFVFEPLNANYCDFCFTKLMGGEFDRLKDGRERCVRCSRTVLRTGRDFQDLFASTRKSLETAFSVTLAVPMVVRMVNAKEIARRTGEKFEPTPGVDPRVLGFAEEGRDGYSLFIENGSPQLAATATIAHELTHIWQFLNWDSREIEERYGARNRLAVYEGMATWAQVQYLLFIREFADAERHEAYAMQREDEYGVGFRLFVERYPLTRDGSIDLDTPFRHRFPL